MCDFPGPGVSHARHPGVLSVSDMKDLIRSACMHSLSLPCCRWHLFVSTRFQDRSKYSGVRFTAAPLLSRMFPTTRSALKHTELRAHQVFIRRCVAFPPATTDPSVRQRLAARNSLSRINANTDSPNMHRGETYGVPSKYWNGVLPSGRTVNLDSRNRA